MYNKVFSTSTRRIIYLCVLAAVVLATSVFMILIHRESINGSLDIPFISRMISYADLPIMFLAGLWGIVPAMVSFLILFIDAVIYDVNSAYTVSIHVIAMIGAYLMSHRRACRHVWSTVLGGLALNAMMGFVWDIIGSIAEGEGLGGVDATSLMDNQIFVAAEVVIYCVCMFFFMNCAPCGIKCAFPMGVDYIEGDDLTGDIRDYRFVHNSRISRKLTWIVVAQALLLGIAASSFAAAMMPSVAEEVLSDTASDLETFFRFDKKPEDTETKQTESSEDTSTKKNPQPGSGIERRLAKQRFIFNNAGAAFIMKLIIMILNAAIPLIVLETAAVQWIVARPVTALANSLNGFAGADRVEQERKLKNLELMRVNSNDEISDLYNSISDMAHQINKNVDNILREAELEEEVREAQRQSEFKTNFLNNVSHELRTPINAVLGLDEMIVRETTEDNIRNYANDIQSAGKSLLSLVNDILDSSKLDEGKMEIIPVEYELGSVINDIVNMIAVKARDKNLEFNMDIDEHLPHILVGDEIRIKQVIVNILTNAVKYTEKGGFTLKLGFEKISDDELMLKCSVSDTGIGIKEEDMEKLFSRFERIEESRNRSIEGTGLGLNIVQQLLGLMDSELEVESEYGRGSTFSFELKQKVVSWQEMGDFVESYRRSMEGNAKYQKKFIAPEAEILVTDDTPMNLTVIKGLLKPTQVKIDTAESGFETLDKLIEKKYDLIFLDHRMPEMDGIETLQQMKDLAGNMNKQTAVIALTANAISGARETYLNAGFADYLSKPIDSAKLEKMLMEYLPEEKVIVAEDEEKAGSAEESVDSGKVVDDEKTDKLRRFSEVPGISYSDAIRNCSNEEVLYSAVKDYTADIRAKADLIEKYSNDRDYENYTVLVHALKSSSRLIGAMSLSDEAKHLEECGDRAKTGDERAILEIEKKTPLLLDLYRGYYDCLSPIFESAIVDPTSDQREEISPEQLNEALTCLRDLAEMFDFDSMDSVIDMLDTYRMPEDFAEKYDKIKQYVHDIDQNALMEELQSCL